MPNVQLNVWIDKQLKDQLELWKQDENKPGMNIIIEDLIKAEMARRGGKTIEQQSLPVITEIVRSEVREATAQLRRELRLDREIEQSEQRDYLRKGFDRLAGLIIFTVRHSGFAYRMAFTLLSKAYGPEFATRCYDDAKSKVEQLLLARKKPDDEQSA